MSEKEQEQVTNQMQEEQKKKSGSSAPTGSTSVEQITSSVSAKITSQRIGFLLFGEFPKIAFVLSEDLM